jgi:inorganic phosphate transporter, PiT family
MSIALIVVLILVLAAEFANGLTDAPNAIATVVSTRVLSPRKAVIMASVMEISGAVITTVTGTAVAATIGKGIVQPSAIGLHTVAAALLTILIWTALAWRLGLPTSKTHEMVAGLAGAGLATAGPSVLLWVGWEKVLIGLVLAIILGFVFGFGLMSIIYRIFNRFNLFSIRKTFGRLQILSSAFMAFSHGTNDGQKFMGIFTLALVLAGIIPEFKVPIWVILLCGVVMGSGTIMGGWRIIKTMGFKLTRLEPVNGFTAETSAGLAIVLSSAAGVPISTTHTINAAIMGVGSTRRFSAVRWGITRRIAATWLLTFPACGLMGYLFTLLIQFAIPSFK